MMFEKDMQFQQVYVVDTAVYKGFIQVFNDQNPLHTNEQFAAAKGFSSCVMHGNILNGFLSHFIGECLPTKDVIIHAQNIQFSKPVYLNDILTLQVTVEDVFESVQTVEFKFNFQNQAAIKVAKGKISIGLI
ncbi:MAG: MaoC/PaaZ C-terminal domain-containing protein [Ferruginibacter sp.]